MISSYEEFGVVPVSLWNKLSLRNKLLGIFPGDPPQHVTPVDQLPRDTELSQEIEKKLPTDPDEIDRIWKAVQDIARG